MKRLKYPIAVLLTIYLWGFILYNILPVKYVKTVSPPSSSPGPNPMVYPYTYIYGLKTVFNAHSGNPAKLLKIAEEKDIDFVVTEAPSNLWINFGGKHVIEEGVKRCSVFSISDIPWESKFFYHIFDYIPRKMVNTYVPDISSVYFPPVKEGCLILSSDQDIIVSANIFGGFDIPTYGYIIGKRRNLILGREVYGDVNDIIYDIHKTICLSDGDKYFRVYGYSEKSFYMPGEVAKYPFRLVIKTDLSDALVFIYRNGKDYMAIDSEGKKVINIPIAVEGAYSIKVFSYRFRLWKIYWGVRWFAYASSIIYKGG